MFLKYYICIRRKISYFLLLLLILLIIAILNRPAYTKRVCINVDKAIRAKHKSCFLRPDTGPCRADLLQWYFDSKLRKCFRFFWGGCQGNGNRFESLKQCEDYCFLNKSHVKKQLPFFCLLRFEYGTCFGTYYRWYWDPLAKSCKRTIYSGCGGNQNNFQTKDECMANCISLPRNELNPPLSGRTTCLPLEVVANLQ